MLNCAELLYAKVRTVQGSDDTKTDVLLLQPLFAGPESLRGKLEGLPTLTSIGNTTFYPQYTPVTVPRSLANPPDVFQSFNGVTKSTCEVGAMQSHAQIGISLKRLLFHFYNQCAKCMKFALVICQAWM